MKRAHALTGPELAKLAGVSLSAWNVHKANGAPVPRTKRQLKAWVDLYAKWRAENLTPGRGPGKAIANSPRREAEEWSAERQKWLAKRAQQIFEEKEGLLVKREEVIEAFTSAITTVKKRLGDVRKKLSPRLYQAPSVEWIDAALGDEFDAICAAFAHGMSDATQRREAGEAEAATPAAGSEGPEGVGAEGDADGQ